MNYNIKILLAITCFIAFSFNKDLIIPTINNNQAHTKDWDEQDKKNKNLQTCPEIIPTHLLRILRARQHPKTYFLKFATSKRCFSPVT